MNKLKYMALAALTPALLFLTACPGGESQELAPAKSPDASAITEDSALEDADKILEDIEGL